jgi:hypothetical protein
LVSEKNSGRVSRAAFGDVLGRKGTFQKPLLHFQEWKSSKSHILPFSKSFKAKKQFPFFNLFSKVSVSKKLQTPLAGKRL